MTNNSFINQVMGLCILSALPLGNAAIATPQTCTYNSNEIVDGSLCNMSTIDNPFCYVHNLAPVRNTDRIIWDGSFSEPSSQCDGPGGRWTGETPQSGRWSPITRRVENDNGDGQLVLRSGTGGPISARVFGQTFGQAAGYLSNGGVEEVIVPSSSVIRVTFTARVTNSPPANNLAWFRTCFARVVSDDIPERLDASIDGASEIWLIDAQTETQCQIDFPLDQFGCPDVDITDWLTMVQFGLGKPSSAEKPTLSIDDIEVNIAQISSGDPINLRPGDILANDQRSWTLIARSHWEGGGEDHTHGLVETPDPCTGDSNWDGVVDIQDLLNVITGWGEPGGPGNVNCDEEIGINDLTMVLSAWGPCP